MGGVKGVNRSEPTPTELKEDIEKQKADLAELDELKTKTDYLKADIDTVKVEVESTKKDIEAVKEKTKVIP